MQINPEPGLRAYCSAQGTEIFAMKKADSTLTDRTRALAKARAAVAAYARNPCAVTAHDVEAAVKDVRHQSAIEPRPRPRAAGAKDRTI